MLTRSIRAQHRIESGTLFGISALRLAAPNGFFCYVRQVQVPPVASLLELPWSPECLSAH